MHGFKSDSPFVGRQTELAELNLLTQKKSASLVVVKGRRRIGKSRLIEEFATDSLFLEFSGLAPEENNQITEQQQRDHFAFQLSEMTSLPHIHAEDWNVLFAELAQATLDKKVIILFDEISWMGSLDSTFVPKLKTAWDRYFKKNPQLILFLCGSVSSWIDKNILRSKLFMGRVSLTLTVKELSISACNKLFTQLGCQFSNYEKFKLLSITGGIPRYIEEINNKLPADENIKRLCFIKSGILVSEFHDIFVDIFEKKHTTYKKIVTTLVDGGATINEISQKISIAEGSHLSECLDELSLAGITNRYFTWLISSGKESKLSQYRLQDNYIRFYLKYIEPNLGKILNDHYEFIDLSSLPGWISIIGLQFENLVLKNRNFILEQLNIRRENIVADNPFFQRKTQRHAGCQIDYMIQTRENVLYICEFKFSKSEIKISVIDEMKEKIKRLSYPRGFAVVPVLIHVNGVSDAVDDSSYFYKIIDFSDLLN
jgi:AAA+ ATPase superfamily predicted ATPase